MNSAARTFAERGGALVTGTLAGAALICLGFHAFLDPGPDDGLRFFLWQLGILGAFGLAAAAVPRVPATLRWASLGLVLASAGTFALGIYAIATSFG